ncbi:MAG: MFS transporter, partial [Pseudomonadota bacterium]
KKSEKTSEKGKSLGPDQRAMVLIFVSRQVAARAVAPKGGAASDRRAASRALWRILLCVYLTATLGSVVFQSTTVALPEIFEERLQGLAQTLAQAMAALEVLSATVIGALAFSVFAAASLAQLVTGFMLDRVGAKPTLVLVTVVQVAFFLIMPGLTGWAAYAVALGFMLGVFGQVPVNDFLIGTTTAGRVRARAFGARYLISFLALSAALPMVAVIQSNWGFDGLFQVLAACAALILVGALVLLPGVPKPAHRSSAAGQEEIQEAKY